MPKFFTFKGGIHPGEFKFTERDAIEDFVAPDVVYIPLSQHFGKPAKPVVKKGDKVYVGSLVGEPDGGFSASIHSSVSGTVKKVDKYHHFSGNMEQTVIIENDGQMEKDPAIKSAYSDSITPEKIIEIARDYGIVGLGGATFPASIKMSPPQGKTFDTLILNGAECEPYLTSDHRLMIEFPEEIILGALLIKKAINANKLIIAIEENKMDAVSVYEKIKDKYKFDIAILKTKYPQGGEKQIIKAILDREVPEGGLPVDIHTYVQNVGTAYALWDAVYNGMPLVKRIVSITGSVKNRKNLKVAIGTPISALIEHCGGYMGEAGKLITGGPMMGIALYTDEIPVTKGTSGVLIQRKEEMSLDEPTNCIRCGRCISSCPMDLMPNLLGDFSEFYKFEESKELGVLNCIECGSCSYVCPAKRHLVQLIKVTKAELKKKGR
ncbi:electron transport complex subunit RsxC [candidate division WOR-3 bacterium]|nr:electron transport complex subunit RsxC [candidate division WOR-3 bacterium]